jgi:hypothetical protein
MLLLLFALFSFGGVAIADGPADEKPTKREHEILRERPSGFWTSNKPAEGGSYRWRLLGIGVGLIGITGFVMFRLVKKADKEREKRDADKRDTDTRDADKPDDKSEHKRDS